MILETRMVQKQCQLLKMHNMNLQKYRSETQNVHTKGQLISKANLIEPKNQ
jgi:hypothetical protein